MTNDFDNKRSSEKKELKEPLSEFREALENEIEAIKKNGRSSTILTSGKKLQHHGEDSWYQFHVDYAPSLPADTPCKLFIGKDRYDVSVISFDENTIVLSSAVPLPDTVGTARLENGATVLLERLIKCIEDNAENENAVGLRMLPPDASIYPARQLYSYDDLSLSPSNTDSQNAAILSALQNDITYIWGPPGTGKTTVIGQIINELYKHNRSVLVVSHTNTAVDGAIEKADKSYSASCPDPDSNYPILRIGTPAKELPERVLLKTHVTQLGKDLYEQKKILECELEALQKRRDPILQIFLKNDWLQNNHLKQIAKQIHDISEYECKLSEMQKKIEPLSLSERQLAEKYSAARKNSAITDAIEQKQKEYDLVCERLHRKEEFVHELSSQIQSARDEAETHDQYAQLVQQEANCKSFSVLKDTLFSLQTHVYNLNSEIQGLKKEKSDAENVRDEYLKKNSLAKFFSGKNAFEQAEANLRKINERLPKAEEELHSLEAQEKDCSSQLEELRLIKKRRRSLIPTKTKEYWEDLLRKYQMELDEAETELSPLLQKKDDIRGELLKMQAQEKETKELLGQLIRVRNGLRKANEQLEKEQTRLDKEKAACSEKIRCEAIFCAAFHSVSPDTDDRLLFDELLQLLAEVEKEIAAIHIPSLQSEKEKIEKKMNEVNQKLSELHQKILELEKQAIMRAKIVGTTLAKSYLSTTLREIKFDTVVLDEASMASIPALWCASYLAESNIIIVGDFLQLPPIVMADTPMANKWLGRDIFYHSGMQECAKRTSACPENFIMLRDQFRMESDIADIANMYYGEYGGLTSHDNAEIRIQEREKFYRWFPAERNERNIHLIDTENLSAWVTGVPQGKGHSRLNCFSAAVDVNLAFKLIEKELESIKAGFTKPAGSPLVLIVAPYKPHITKINHLIDLEYRNRGFSENLNLIKAGTIHTFQGSEADIVIFDLVIDEPHWKANLFLTDKETNDNLRKMFNVAVTRAKFKLYIVGNFAYCMKRAKNNALSDLLDKVIQKNKCPREDAKMLLPDLTFSRSNEISLDGKLNGIPNVFREDNFFDYFMEDIHSFKRQLIIYSPFITENRLSMLLPSFVDAINDGKQIIIVTKAMSDRNKSEYASYEKCEAELRKIGVSVIHKKGMHEKLIFVDDEAVWIGSLNALSFTGSTGEIMLRLADREISAEDKKLFEIDHICQSVAKAYEQRCPICGNELVLKEGADGGIYWDCINGDYSRSSTQQYPIDGILRCKCGAPYSFSMKNEPRWVCTENSRHYQKMRESDLKLEKMASLIPARDRKSIKQYFAQKHKAKPKNSPNKKIDSEKSVFESIDSEQLSMF